MYLFRWRFVSLDRVIWCVIFLAMFPREAIAASWKERLLAEAPPKWTAMEEYYSKMEVSFRQYVPVLPQSLVGRAPDLAYFDIRKNGDMMVSSLRRVGKYADGKKMDQLRILGINKRYAFKLAKTSPDADTFILEKYESASDEIRQQVQSRGGLNFTSSFRVNGMLLSEFVKDSLVTITDIRSLQRGGREIAQLDYHRQLVYHDSNDPSKNKIIGTEEGVVVLDPEHCWCIREHHFVLPSLKCDVALEYGDDVDGFPILRRVQDTTVYKNSTGTMRTVWEFDKLVHRDIPESEFTLSAFGMPEMQLPGDQRPHTLWRWMIGIGIALAALAILLRVYWQRRRQVRQTA